MRGQYYSTNTVEYIFEETLPNKSRKTKRKCATEKAGHKPSLPPTQEKWLSFSKCIHRYPKSLRIKEEGSCQDMKRFDAKAISTIVLAATKAPSVFKGVNKGLPSGAPRFHFPS